MAFILTCNRIPRAVLPTSSNSTKLSNSSHEFPRRSAIEAKKLRIMWWPSSWVNVSARLTIDALLHLVSLIKIMPHEYIPRGTLFGVRGRNNLVSNSGRFLRMSTKVSPGTRLTSTMSPITLDLSLSRPIQNHIDCSKLVQQNRKLRVLKGSLRSKWFFFSR